ncbi:hypothetical protein EDB84DRAFT_1446957 [Lactarius hengduanensis]|nr:hypothetical protein EDB84DRAFT_1446957 [Lactarius hengduanensis]
MGNMGVGVGGMGNMGVGVGGMGNMGVGVEGMGMGNMGGWGNMGMGVGGMGTGNMGVGVGKMDGMGNMGIGEWEHGGMGGMRMGTETIMMEVDLWTPTGFADVGGRWDGEWNMGTWEQGGYREWEWEYGHGHGCQMGNVNMRVGVGGGDRETWGWRWGMWRWVWGVGEMGKEIVCIGVGVRGMKKGDMSIDLEVLLTSIFWQATGTNVHLIWLQSTESEYQSRTHNRANMEQKKWSILPTCKPVGCSQWVGISMCVLAG